MFITTSLLKFAIIEHLLQFIPLITNSVFNYHSFHLFHLLQGQLVDEFAVRKARNETQNLNIKTDLLDQFMDCWSLIKSL